jgi:hypothetical protein
MKWIAPSLFMGAFCVAVAIYFTTDASSSRRYAKDCELWSDAQDFFLWERDENHPDRDVAHKFKAHRRTIWRTP